MKCIIMCGGIYREWEQPKHLLKVGGETIVERTIRLLRESGVTDIAISANDPRFDGFGVPVLHHDNLYDVAAYNRFTGYWCNCFYPMNEPACYIFGDVIFSPAAIRKIVATETDDIAFFASRPPFPLGYMKKWAEPFAFKVADQDHLKRAIFETKALDMAGVFRRKPLAWEFWAIVRGQEDPNAIDYDSYTVINDYTCDIDNEYEIETLVRYVEDLERKDVPCLQIRKE